MARDYKAEYERRKARAQSRGYRSPREETQYQATKKTRTKKLTLYNYRQIQEAKRRRAAAERAKIKIKATKELAARKSRTLKKFGLTVTQLNKLRRQNRDYSLKTKSPRLLYNLALDEDVNNWSNERIGYIKNYNDVFVNPSARRTYAQRKRAYDKIEQWDLFSDYQELFDYSKSGHEAPKAA